MSDKLPSPNEILGRNKLPSPDEILKKKGASQLESEEMYSSSDTYGNQDDQPLESSGDGDLYTYGGIRYKKINNKWYREYNGSFVRLSSGNVAQREKELNANAKRVAEKVGDRSDKWAGVTEGEAVNKPKYRREDYIDVIQNKEYKSKADTRIVNEEALQMQKEHQAQIVEESKKSAIVDEEVPDIYTGYPGKEGKSYRLMDNHWFETEDPETTYETKLLPGGGTINIPTIKIKFNPYSTEQGWAPITQKNRLLSLNNYFNKEASLDSIDEVFTNFDKTDEKKYNLYKIDNGEWKRLIPGAAEYSTVSDKNAIDALNNRYGKDVKYKAAISPTVKPDKLKFVDINSSLTAKTEEDAVAYLEKKYKDYGFSFYQEGLFNIDRVRVKASNGKEITVNFDEKNPDEALKLRNFLEQNASKRTPKISFMIDQKIGNIRKSFNADDSYDISRALPTDNAKTKAEINKYYNSEEYKNIFKSLSFNEMDAEVKSRNTDHRGYGLSDGPVYEIYKKKKEERYNITDQKIKSLYEQLSIAETSGNKVLKKQIKSKIETYLSKEVMQDQVLNYNIHLNDLVSSAKTLTTDIKQYEVLVENFNKTAETMSKEVYESQKKILEDKAESLEIRRDNISTSFNNIDKSQKKINVLAGEYVKSKAKVGSFLGGIANSFLTGIVKIWDTAIIGSMHGYDVAYGVQTYVDPEESKYYKDQGYTDQEIRNISINETTKRQKEALRSAVTGLIGSETTKEYMSSKDVGFFEKALYGVAESAPAMLASFAGPQASFSALASLSYSSVEDEMLDDPDFKGTSAAERSIVAIPYAILMGALENYGLKNAVKGESLTGGLFNGIISRSLKSMPEGFERVALEKVINKEVKSLIGKGIIRIVNGSLAEFETGATQSLVLDIGLKALYNTAKGKKMRDGKIEKLTGGEYFSTPDSFSEGATRVWEDGLMEAIGGMTISTFSTVTTGIMTGNISLYNEEDLKFLNEMSTDKEFKKIIVANLKSDILKGKLTRSEAEAELQNMNEFSGMFESIPDNISPEDQIKSINLVAEKIRLTKQIEGKDPALVAAQTDRINEINDELKIISENATKETTDKQQAVTAESGVSEYQGTSEGQQEVGVSEGGQREATVNETDSRNSTIPSQVQEEVASKDDVERRREEDLSTYDEEGLNEVYSVGSDQTVGEFINAKYDAELAALGTDTKADIKRRREEELDSIGQKAVQRRLQDLREAVSEKQIAQAIINIEKNAKRGAKITKEEQDFVTQKKQELKDKGFEIVDHTGKIWDIGLNLEVLNFKILDEGTNLTQEEIDVFEKELENRKRKKERLKEKGLSEQEIDNQFNDTISVMTTVQPQLNKDGKMVQAAKVDILQIEVSQAEEILERSKKNPKNTQQARENKINAKYDAELAALGTTQKSDQVATLRAEEQAELLEVIPKIENYKVNGEIDKTLMPKTVLDKYNKVYNKYDKLISPLLETTSEATTAKTETKKTEYKQNLVTPENSREIASKQNTPLRQKIAKSAAMIMRALPGVKIYLHNNQSEVHQALANSTGQSLDKVSKEIGNSAGSHVKGEIHINMENANETTMLHEAFHEAILRSGKSIKTIIDFANGLKNIISDKAIKAKLEEFASRYNMNINEREKAIKLENKKRIADGRVAMNEKESDNYISSLEEPTKSDEFLTELGAIMAEAETELTTTKLQQFLNLINRIAKRLRLPVIIKSSATAQEAVDFINSMARSLRTGEAIEGDNKGDGKIKKQAEKLFLEETPKFKSLDDVSKYIQSWVNENKLFDKSIEDVSDQEVVNKFAEHVLNEIRAWESIKGSEYVGFYNEDIPQRLNPELQKFAKQRYGRELTGEEVSLYHMVSAFASPAADPHFDSSKGLEVFDKYMMTGDLSAYGTDQATIWDTDSKGKRYDTGKLKFDDKGNPVYKQVAKAYATKSLEKFNNIVNNFNGDVSKAVNWVLSNHSFDDASKMMGKPTTGKKENQLEENEYFTKENGGTGVFAITGAKLGSYILNRIGDYSTVTKDMWYARTLARLAGESLTEKGKAIKSPWASNTKQGLRKRKLADKAFEIVAKELGTNPADVQQKIWDFEKRLYEKLGAVEKSSYASEGLKSKAKQILSEQPSKIKQQKTGVEGEISQEDGKNIFYPKESLGLKRSEMPQIRTRFLPILFDKLKNDKISFEDIDGVMANTLKPSQNEINIDNTDKFKKDVPYSKKVIVSSDNYIIDGHHRWYYSSMNDLPIDITKIDLPIQEALSYIGKLDFIEQDEIGKIKQQKAIKSEPVVGNKLFNEPLKEAGDIAESYMKSIGKEYVPVEKITKLDEGLSKRISDAYDQMKNDPNDPKVKAAYEAMSKETLDQYDAILSKGYKVELNNNDLYSSSEDMIKDLRDNRKMNVFPTESGFGDEAITDKQRKENVLLRDSGRKDANGKVLLVNDVFRFVHDFFGHAKLGNSFGPIGEENAWRVHSEMYSPEAKKAMTSETRGQNSFVNFSGVNDAVFKKRDKARELRKEGKIDQANQMVEEVYNEMKFADQKLGILPSFAIEEGSPSKIKQQKTAPNGKPSKLDDAQWEQVRTPAFKKWFGDWENDPKNASKVVDENGEPLVVYHGSRSTVDFAFSEFNVPEEGVFFSSDYRTASWFSSGADPKLFFEKIKIPTYLNENSNLEDLEKYIKENLDPTAFTEINNITDGTINYRLYQNYETISSPLGKTKELAQKRLYKEILNNIDYINKKETRPFYHTFLNIKNPYVINAKGKTFDKTPFKGKEYAAVSVSAEIKRIGKNDGVIIKNTIETTEYDYKRTSDTYIAFESNQIKLADGTNTTFDATQPSIKLQKTTQEIRMDNESESVFKKSLDRGTTWAKATQNALDYIQKSKWYQDATDVEREQKIRDFKQSKNQKLKKAPSVAKVLGKPKPNMVTVNESAAFKDQLRLEAKAAREAKADLNSKRKSLSDAIKGMVKLGKLKVSQASTIIKRVGQVNLDNPVMVDRLIDYASKVFERADYQERLDKAFSYRRDIKSLLKTDNQAQVVGMANEFAKIDPSMVENIDDYIAMAEIVKNAVAPSKVKVLDVVLKEAANIEAVSNFSKDALEKQDQKLKDELLATNNDLLESGAISGDMTIKEIQEILNAIKDPTYKMDSQEKERYIRSYLSKRFESLASIVTDIIKTNQNPFTGEKVAISEKNRAIILDLLKVDMSEMSIRDAIFAVEAMDNFVNNGITSKLEGALSAYKGQLGLKQEIKSGKVARALKLYFSKKIGRYFATEFTPLPLMMERMFSGVKSGISVMRSMGLDLVINGVNKANYLHNKIINEYYEKFIKNSKTFHNPENIYERGMLSFLKRNVTGSLEEMKAETSRRIKMIQESIATLMNDGDESQKAMAEIYQKVFDKLGVSTGDIDVIDARASKENRDAVDWWVSEWSKHYQDLHDVSLSVYNYDLGSDINYTPDRYKTIKTESFDQSLTERNSSFLINMDHMTDKSQTGVLMQANRPKVMPEGRYISLDFDTNNSSSLKGALVDINTAAGIRQVDGFLNSKLLSKLIPVSEDRSVLIQRTNRYIRRAKGKIFIPTDLYKDVDAVLNFAASLGVGKALGGVLQSVKQTIPIAISTAINTGKFNMSNFEFNEWLNKAGMPISNRGIESLSTIESMDRRMEAKGTKVRDSLKWIQEKQQLYVKWFLSKPDVFIARSGFQSYYLQYMGESSIDWANHEPNQDALNYAQAMVDRQQNISDPMLGGEFLTAEDGMKRMAKKILFPFASFGLNQKARLNSDIINMVSKTTSTEDKKIAVKSALATITEMLAYRAISVGIGYGFYKAAAAIISGLIGDDDDDDKENSLKWLLSATKFPLKSMVNDIVSPIQMTDRYVTMSTDFLLSLTTGDTEAELDELVKQENEIRSLKDQDQMTERQEEKFRQESKNKSLYQVGSKYDDNAGLGMISIASDLYKKIYDDYTLATTGEFQDDYKGNVTIKRIRPVEQDLMKNTLYFSALFAMGVLPKESDQMVTKVVSMIKKNAMSESEYEKYEDFKKEFKREPSPFEMGMIKSEKKYDYISKDIDWVNRGGGLNLSQGREYVKLLNIMGEVNGSALLEIKAGKTADQISKSMRAKL